MKPTKQLIISGLLLGSLVVAGAEFCVSSSGSDSGDGSQARPFATIERAQQELRKEGGGTILLESGVYLRDTSVNFGAADKGMTLAARPDASVRIVGGRLIPPEEISRELPENIQRRLPEESRPHVVMIDLKKLGIKHIGPFRDLFGNMNETDNGGVIDLYFNGTRLYPARWPNEDYTTMREVTDNGDPRAKRGGAFLYRGDRPERWLEAVKEGLWLRGFWRVPWVCQSVRIESIDTEKKEIRHAVGLDHGGIGSKYTPVVNGLRKGDGKELYYAFNLPEELDRPGEWYLESRTGKLYLWPPAEVRKESILISDLAEPVIQLKGADGVILRGLTVEGGLRAAVSVKDSDDVKILGCIFRNTGAQGVQISGGRNNEVRSCDFFQIGAVPIEVQGGDRRSLTPAGHRIVNNHLHHFGEVAKISNGIEVQGVGNYIAHNLIHDGNYGGIQYRGNNHVMEYNELHNLGLDGGDYGAFYSNGDWASAGNRIQYNFAHHITGNFSYMDDGHSSDATLNNLNYKVAAGIFWGGGHCNTAHGNIFVENPVAIHVDSRGVPRKYDAASGVHMRDWRKFAENNPVYENAYPWVATIPFQNPTLPTGNVITGNYLIHCAVPLRLAGDREHFEFMKVADNPESESLAIFRNPEHLDFNLKPGAKVVDGMAWLAKEFPKMGLQRDEFRKMLPDDPGRYEFRSKQRVFDSTVDMDASNRIEKKK